MPLISNPSFPGRMTNKNESNANNLVRLARRLSFVLRSWFLHGSLRSQLLEFEHRRRLFFYYRVEIRHLLRFPYPSNTYSEVIFQLLLL